MSLWNKLRMAAGFLPHLPLYLDVRDRVLATPDGWFLTDLYYTHSDEIYALMEGDPALREQGLGITAAQVQAMDSFLSNLAAAGSPGLQQVIADERARLGPLQDFVGLTMEEARGVVLGYAVFLPVVRK